MKVYLVGGAVRDELLGLPVKEKDWVVVGATPQQMIELGYKPVGKDFPVFLHPETKEEYALARTERKVGKGYTGFVFDASPEVTLEEDLLRRDLTINAIAKSKEGEIIDPFQGREAIANKTLRHVSLAFAEDPVRILRVGRFAARFADLGFTVAPETTELMRQMVKAGEVDALVAERVWKEWERALAEKNPENFFEVLADCGAASILFPQLFSKSRSVKTLKKSVSKTNDTQVRFASLLHALSEDEVREICSRYKVPADYRDLILLVVRYQDQYRSVEALDGESILNLLQAVDAFRREERFVKYLLVCEICFGGDKESKWLKKCFEAAKNVDIKQLINKELPGNEIAEQIRQARIKAINDIS